MRPALLPRFLMFESVFIPSYPWLKPSPLPLPKFASIRLSSINNQPSTIHFGCGFAALCPLHSALCT